MARVLEADRPERTVEVEIREGRTHYELANAATDWNADLVVVGEHGQRPVLVTHVRLQSSTPRGEGVGQELERCARCWIEEMITRMGGDLDEIHVVVAYGESRHEIQAALKLYQTDLVVMGSHGAGDVSRTLLGSVATAIVRGSACPVIVVGDKPNA